MAFRGLIPDGAGSVCRLRGGEPVVQKLFDESAAGKAGEGEIVLRGFRPGNWDSWYDKNIPVAEHRYDVWLSEGER